MYCRRKGGQELNKKTERRHRKLWFSSNPEDFKSIKMKPLAPTTVAAEHESSRTINTLPSEETESLTSLPANIYEGLPGYAQSKLQSLRSRQTINRITLDNIHDEQLPRDNINWEIDDSFEDEDACTWMPTDIHSEDARSMDGCSSSEDITDYGFECLC